MFLGHIIDGNNNEEVLLGYAIDVISMGVISSVPDARAKLVRNMVSNQKIALGFSQPQGGVVPTSLLLYYFFFLSSLLLSSLARRRFLPSVILWASRGHRCHPFCPLDRVVYAACGHKRSTQIPEGSPGRALPSSIYSPIIYYS